MVGGNYIGVLVTPLHSRIVTLYEFRTYMYVLYVTVYMLLQYLSVAPIPQKLGLRGWPYYENSRLLIYF